MPIKKPAFFLITFLFLVICPFVANAGEQISIAAVGDIMMGTTYPEKKLPPKDGFGIFDHVKKEFQGHDIVFGNLEGPLIDQGFPSKCLVKSEHCNEFRMPVRYVNYLNDAVFNVMSIANNHAFDFGFRGIQSTKNTLESANIKTAGGKDIAYLNIKGKKIAIAGFSFSSSSPYSYSIKDIPQAAKIVKELKESNDIVIVSFHGGAEGRAAVNISDSEEIFLEEKRGNVIKFSRTAIDAGADLVIGHGPHVLRAMEVYKGKLIAYSLGNFLTYGFSTSGPNGLSVILKIKVDSETGNFIDGELIPVKLLNQGIPEVDLGRQAIKLIKKLTVQDMPSTPLLILDDGYLSLL
jgi:poly-gamma-glutamate capsule biosynthesis protein CapA/YwtB (metallophosphatase superfamily)